MRTIFLLILLLVSGPVFGADYAAIQTADGTAVSASNPLPVTFGTGNQTISGDLTVDGTLYSSGEGAHNVVFNEFGEYLDNTADRAIYLASDNGATLAQFTVDGSLYVDRIGINRISQTSPISIKSPSTDSSIIYIESSDGTPAVVNIAEASNHGRITLYDSGGNVDILLDSAAVSYINTGANFSIGTDITPDARLEVGDGSLTAANSTALLVGGPVEVDASVYVDGSIYLTSAATGGTGLWLSQPDGGCSYCTVDAAGTTFSCTNQTCPTGM